MQEVKFVMNFIFTSNDPSSKHVDLIANDEKWVFRPEFFQFIIIAACFADDSNIDIFNQLMLSVISSNKCFNMIFGSNNNNELSLDQSSAQYSMEC